MTGLMAIRNLMKIDGQAEFTTTEFKAFKDSFSFAEWEKAGRDACKSLHVTWEPPKTSV